jgi:hypothetical protein
MVYGSGSAMGNADSQFPYKTGREVSYVNANGWRMYEGTHVRHLAHRLRSLVAVVLITNV